MLQRLIRAWAPRLVLLAVLALAVLVVFSGSTQARYTSDTVQTSDSARVAKWNVSLTTAENQAGKLTLNASGNAWYEEYTFNVSSDGCEVALSYDIVVSNLPANVKVYLAQGTTVAVDDSSDAETSEAADDADTSEEDADDAAKAATYQMRTSQSAGSTLTFEDVGTFAAGDTDSQTWTLRFAIDSANATSFTQNTIGVSVSAKQID